MRLSSLHVYHHHYQAKAQLWDLFVVPFFSSSLFRPSFFFAYVFVFLHPVDSLTPNTHEEEYQQCIMQLFINTTPYRVTLREVRGKHCLSYLHLLSLSSEIC